MALKCHVSQDVKDQLFLDPQVEGVLKQLRQFEVGEAAVNNRAESCCFVAEMAS